MAKLATNPKPATSALVQTATRPEVALLYHKDGESYWVRGYECFDP